MESKDYMFSTEALTRMTGGTYELANKSQALQDMERRFREECEKRGLEVSYDCTADEPMGFKTLNYTTYAGMFIMHPLNPETCLRQTYAAFTHKSTYPQLDYIPAIMNRVTGGKANKYILNDCDRPDLPNDLSGVVVLPGQNLLTTQVCLNQLRRIAMIDGVVFKPHPLTDSGLIRDLADQTPGAWMLDKDVDLYSILPMVDTVYTTHVSESALYGFVLGKKLVPIDAIQNRRRGSFTHINYHLFFNQADKSWLNTLISAPCSGIIHPEVDKDWEQKMDLYLNFILTDRERVKDFFILSDK